MAVVARWPGHRDRAGDARPTTASGSAGPAAPRPAWSRSTTTACDWTPSRCPREEIEGFYEGFSNATLWPLYHDVVAKPEFHREWWDSYVAVNRRFAEHAADRAAKGATVWVHDYQLQLVPQMLRELRPDLHIGFFLHIPFPPAELFQQLPWRRQILEGLLGADLVGFQLPGGAQNFVRLVRQRVGHKTHRDLVYLPDGRTVRASAFPISIDVEGFEELARRSRSSPGPRRSARPSAARARCSSASTGSTTPRASTPACARSASSSPTASSTSRTRSSCRSPPRRGSASSSTASCATTSTASSAASTATSAGSGSPVISYLHASYPREEMAALYRAADIMVVSPYRDGMNLVAKEYVACRYDDGGALILSEFAGAAYELRQAWLINPYDLNGMKAALREAYQADEKDLTRRMRAMRRTIKSADITAWARSFLEALEDIRPAHGKSLLPADKD